MYKKKFINKILIFIMLLIISFSAGRYFNGKCFKIKKVENRLRLLEERPYLKFLDREIATKNTLTTHYKTSNSGKECLVEPFAVLSEKKISWIRMGVLICFLVILIIGVSYALIFSFKKINRISGFISSQKNNLIICIGLFVIICSSPFIQQRNYLGYSGKYLIYTNNIAVFFTALGTFLFIWGILRKIDQLKDKK